MLQNIRINAQWVLSVLAGACLLLLFVLVQPAGAIERLPDPDPAPGAFGVEATKPKDPPTEAARISTPGNNSSFANSPITISGICETGLLVQVYNNGVMAGSVMCENGSFSLEASLFAGTNEFSAILYDELDQDGPVSNLITVDYTDTSFSAFGQLITLTSSYGRRSAPAGTELNWPFQLTGGTGPYALSINWGDGTSDELKSQSIAGLVTLAHTYQRAGIYNANVKVTDINGVSAFMQVVSVSNGKVDGVVQAEEEAKGEKVVVLWIPAAIALILLLPTFWLGRRSQVVSLRNKLLKEREEYNNES